MFNSESAKCWPGTKSVILLLRAVFLLVPSSALQIGNLVPLPLKLNSYIRLSGFEIQEGISQMALIIHILSLLPPFFLLIFLQVIKS